MGSFRYRLSRKREEGVDGAYRGCKGGVRGRKLYTQGESTELYTQRALTGCREGLDSLCRDLDFLFYTRAPGGDAGTCARIRTRVYVCVRVHVTRTCAYAREHVREYVRALKQP